MTQRPQVQWGPARQNHAIHAAPAMASVEVDGRLVEARIGRPDRQSPTLWTLRDASTGAHIKLWTSWDVSSDVWFAAWTDGPGHPGSGRYLLTLLVEENGGAVMEL